MGATVLFILIILPIICSVAFVSILVMSNKSIAETERGCEYVNEPLCVHTPAAIA